LEKTVHYEISSFLSSPKYYWEEEMQAHKKSRPYTKDKTTKLSTNYFEGKSEVQSSICADRTVPNWFLKINDAVI
jgi:hypothetical protein